MPTCKHDLFLCKRQDFKINLACGACPSSPHALIREEATCPRTGGSILSPEEPGGPGQHTWEVAVLPHCWSISLKRPGRVLHVLAPYSPAPEPVRQGGQTLPHTAQFRPRYRNSPAVVLSRLACSHDDHPHFTCGETEAKEVSNLAHVKAKHPGGRGAEMRTQGLSLYLKCTPALPHCSANTRPVSFLCGGHCRGEFYRSPPPRITLSRGGGMEVWRRKG